MTITRERTHRWEDPAAAVVAARGLSGLEFLQAIAGGDLPAPPIASTLGFDGVEVGPGEATFFITPAEFHYNPIGSVHGGLTATLLDSALGCAVHTTLPAGARYTTVELKVNFIKAVTARTGQLRCHAKVIHVGGRIGSAEARVTDQQGALYAHATATCLIVRDGGAT